MRIPTHKAAAELNLHPADFVLSIAHMVGGLADCWPSVDDGFVDTVRITMRGYAPAGRHGEKTPATEKSPPAPAQLLPVSIDAAQILDRMARKEFWGGKTTVWDQVNRIFGRGIEDINPALAELEKVGFVQVQGEGKKAQFSLVTSKKAAIMKVVAAYRDNSAQE